MKHKVARLAAVTGIVLLLAAVTVAVAGILRARMLLYGALDGRRERVQTQESVTRFELLAETAQSQVRPRISGWLSVIEPQTVTLMTDRGELYARTYGALDGAEDAPWALVFHGGPGSSGEQVQDIACELSLAGYRVVTPDLYAHGESAGQITTLGGAETEDVLAWVEWVMGADASAQIVLMGQDEGALAVLMAAAQGMPGAVKAVATDSAYPDAALRARALMRENGFSEEGLDMMLLRTAYQAINGVPLESGLFERLSDVKVPLLVMHGTGDQDVPAWHSEDIALAVGENAELYYVEGAGHGMARYVDPKGYYDALIGFFDRATQHRSDIP